MFCIGYFLQNTAINRLLARDKDREPMSVLFFTSGFSTALEALALIVFGGFALQAQTSYMGKSIRLGEYIISQTKLISL